MSYTANQYNYATPLASSADLVGESLSYNAVKHFTLFNNSLDGSFYPISGDVGLWGNTFSNELGYLAEPFVVDVTEHTVFQVFRLVGSTYCYPVDFVVTFFDGNNVIYTIDVLDNTEVEYAYYFPYTIAVTGYRVQITRISSGNDVARLFNLYNPGHIKRVDTLLTSLSEVSDTALQLTLKLRDDMNILVNGRTHITNTIDPTSDIVRPKQLASAALTNIHTRMKDPSRRVYGKVYITYTDPMLAGETTVTSDSIAYNSDISQVLDGTLESDGRLFALYENDLTGGYYLSDAYSQTGWVSSQTSGADGVFTVPPVLRINFASRPIITLTVHFDDSRGVVPEDFTVDFVHSNGTATTKTFTGNTLGIVPITEEPIGDVTSIVVTFTKMSKGGYPAAVLDIPVISTILYTGYQDRSNLMSIDLLEELTYEDEIEALGGVSANEVTVVLDNSNDDFYFNNSKSPVSSSLRRNRKIVPWLGVEIVPGEIEWYTLGTYWAYKWNVPVNSLVATVVGFDTIGLLDTTDFTDHPTLVGKSIGELIEYVLEDARKTLNFIEYAIDPALYQIIIPYAWFEARSHTAALRKISKCYPMHIYCDRQGRICAAPQKLKLDYYYDTWADDTNVIDKTYDSLYTTLPNIVNVTTHNPVLVANDELTRDTVVFNVEDIPSRTLNFNRPYLSDFAMTVDCDDTVSYSYSVYSWGVDITFTGTGNVRAITCTGTSVDNTNTSTLSRRDADSIRLNGAVVRNIDADFIQTSSLASEIIGRIFSLSEYDKYDATVNYRGDISLTINDPILLLNGIAPDNRYNIKRHQLSWNGALSGSAYLNT